jgi:hypothetical protein
MDAQYAVATLLGPFALVAFGRWVYLTIAEAGRCPLCHYRDHKGASVVGCEYCADELLAKDMERYR